MGLLKTITTKVKIALELRNSVSSCMFLLTQSMFEFLRNYNE